MYSNRYSASISRHPEAAKAFRRLQDYFRGLERENADLFRIRLDPERIAEIAQTRTFTELSRLLFWLLQDQLMTRVLVLESPEGGAVVEFGGNDTIPSTVHDWRRDIEMSISLNDLTSVYRPRLQ